HTHGGLSPGLPPSPGTQRTSLRVPPACSGRLTVQNVGRFPLVPMPEPPARAVGLDAPRLGPPAPPPESDHVGIDAAVSPLRLTGASGPGSPMPRSPPAGSARVC